MSPAVELLNNYLAIHAVHVMKGAVVKVMPFVGKEDPDSRRPGRHLGQSGPVRFRCLNEPGGQETIWIKGRRRGRNRILLWIESGIARGRPGSCRRSCRAIDRS